MQNNEENIDKLFRSQLTGYEISPPPGVWDNITSSLVTKRKKRRAAWLWTASAAASIALAFILGWHLSDQPSEHNAYMAELELIKTQVSKEELTEPKIEQKIEIKDEQKNIASFNNSPKHVQLAENKQTYENKAQSTPPTYLTSSDVIINKPVINENLIQKHNKTMHLSEADRMIIKSNMAKVEAQQNKKAEPHQSKWSVGIKASPEYRFDNLLTQNYEYTASERDFSMAAQNNINTTYTSNVSGGISVSYKTSKRLSFISGINYNELTQSANNIALAFAGHNWVNNTLEAEYTTNDVEPVRSASTGNNAIISTSAGLANIKMPQGVQLAKAQPMYSSIATAAEEYNYEQKAGYIEVPLLMNYQVIDKKVGLHLLGGINTNFLVSNDVYLSQNDNSIASGNIEGLRDITF
ncbi:MAG: outer membrane beta-barrel protein, partial [Bacteroidales bacterium]|nr:outer membrane beta-barrel protein [Bacteroidales bacterium]